MVRYLQCLLCLLATPAWAWYGEGHVRATNLAVNTLSDRLPAFFVTGMATIAHCSVDPDTFKFSTGGHLLQDTEYSEHFFESEYFDNETLPADRIDFFYWCLKPGMHVKKIGTLPYALGEATERLTVALAEYRRWPENPAIQTKCLVYAGNLAHYAEDLCQPLHTTIDYDGRANAKGTSPQTGIHAQVDALIEKLDPNRPPTMAPETIRAYSDLLPAILAEIVASNQQVDAVYSLEDELPAASDNTPLDPNSAVGQFALKRWSASARVTACFFLTAWVQSEQVDIPDWHER